MRTFRNPHGALAMAGLLLLGACHSAPERTWPSDARSPIDIETLAERVADYDVVFLGELHDDDRAHRLQFELMRELHRRGEPVVLSFEMFESDVQWVMDAYLSGMTSEDAFLADSRPWPNYVEHYRPAVEFARAEGLPVICANLERAVARVVSRKGLAGARGAEGMPRRIHLDTPEYHAHFVEAMGGHGGAMGPEMMARFYAAQCAKDDKMAESIDDFLEDRGGEDLLVLHWCGRFHSDGGLGTVERLRKRNPDLDLAVISTLRTGDADHRPTQAEREVADFLWVSPYGVGHR